MTHIRRTLSRLFFSNSTKDQIASFVSREPRRDISPAELAHYERLRQVIEAEPYFATGMSNDWRMALLNQPDTGLPLIKRLERYKGDLPTDFFCDESTSFIALGVIGAMPAKNLAGLHQDIVVAKQPKQPKPVLATLVKR